jgi:hypothetical protein
VSESPESRGRDVLPIPHRVPPHSDHVRREGSGHLIPRPSRRWPPPGAPNALVVLTDDCGFGASSAHAHDLAAEQPERLVDL